MIILTLNCGSSSVKFQVYHWEQRDVLVAGIVERIGQEAGSIELQLKQQKITEQLPIPDHKDALSRVLQLLVEPSYAILHSLEEIGAVGHRVVHGGELFTHSVIIDAAALEVFEACIPLAPLHQPANLIGVKAAKALLPKVVHCAIMDTAWHQTMAPEAFLYAVPYTWYKDLQIRKYGFHGTSFLYTSRRAAVLLGKKPEETHLIIAHIGNGASMCAIRGGVSVDTTMGLTPLEGLIMGTRSGDLDPAILPYAARHTGKTIDEIETILNTQSGLLGITERYIDRRDIRDAAADGDVRAQLAINMECLRIKKYIGAYIAAYGAIDALVFTAGVGEMAPHIREGVLKGLETMGIVYDKEKNRQAMSRNAELCISAEGSPVNIFIIPTDEELVITEDTYALVQGTYSVGSQASYSFEKPDYVHKERAAAFSLELAEKPRLKHMLAGPLPESLTTAVKEQDNR